jgi:hypothetical protein
MNRHKAAPDGGPVQNSGMALTRLAAGAENCATAVSLLTPTPLLAILQLRFFQIITVTKQSAITSALLRRNPSFLQNRF